MTVNLSRNTLTALLLLPNLLACSEPLQIRRDPGGTQVDPLTYAAEYSAVAKVLEIPFTDLYAISFVELPADALRDHCGDALACAYLPRPGSPGTVFLPPAEGPCALDQTGARYFSELVMHEIAHALGYNHGLEMTEILEESWLVYLESAPCVDLANFFLPPAKRPATVAAKKLMGHRPSWVSLHPSTHALSGVATLVSTGTESWEWVLMTEGAVLHEVGKVHGNLEEAKAAVESVAREYSFIE